MSIKGYVDYKRREFCKDVKCPVQLKLDAQEEGSREYEQIRQTCKENCRYTTYQFHHWLMEKGYLIIRPEKEVQ
jgi:Iap family predicted aminopeptidase